MKKILPLILIVFAFSVQLSLGQNAPISTVGNVTSTGTTLVVPITATDFTNIGSCNMQLLYNPAIATCTGVTIDPSLPGSIDYYLGNPGVITFGWYTWPGATLPDNSVIFNLSFTKVTPGTSPVTWNDSYGERQWSDGNSLTLNDLPPDTYYIDGSFTFQGNAPITIAPTFGACPGTTIAVPIKVLDFNTIGVFSLTLQFSASVLTYQSYTNTSGFPGLGVLNPNIGNITIAGFAPASSPGVTLADSATLVTLYFTYLSGTTTLTWYDDGTSCEYGGPPLTYSVLNDIPASTYYIPGQIGEFCASYWTGNIDDDWFKTGNWTNGIPSVTKDALIPEVDPNPYPVITGNASSREADIDAAASLTIQTNGTLTAQGDFNNDGSLLIKSSATSDGSFIDNGTITGTGTASVERYLLNEMWHFVSPPISDGVSNVYYDIYLRSYIEPTSTWFFIVPVDIPMNTLQGYEAWASDFYTGTTTVTYTGTLHTGNLSKSDLTYTPTAPVSNGYNLVGNPYPSAVDWDISSGWTKTNLDDAIYIWNPYAGNYSSYVDGVGNNGGTNIIPSGQGFFVHVNSVYSGGSISVNNNARLHDNAPFLKNTPKPFENTQLRLKITGETNTYWDETIIQFAESSSPAFDPSMDAFKLNGFTGAPELYTHSADLDELSINSLPVLMNNTMIPLYFKAGSDGTYRLEATELLNFEESTKIILEDKTLEVITDLAEQSHYEFDAQDLDDPYRFNLHFVVNSLGAEDNVDKSDILIYASGNFVYLKALNLQILNGTIQLYDVMGRLLVTDKISNVSSYRLRVESKGMIAVSFHDATKSKIYQSKILIH
jgi:hypothetical protein